MNTTLGRTSKPITCETIKEVKTSDETRKIKLWRATYSSHSANVAVFFCDTVYDNSLTARECFNTFDEALDWYYSLINNCYKVGYVLKRRNPILDQ